MQLEHSAVERAAEPALVRVLPRPVHDCERNVFVRRSGGKDDRANVGVLLVLDDAELCSKEGRVSLCTGTSLAGIIIRTRSLGLVDEVGIKDVELVALDDLGRRVVGAV